MSCEHPTEEDYDVLVQQLLLAQQAVGKAFPLLNDKSDAFVTMVAAAVQAIAIATKK
jgi:hypothetical protein